MKTFRDKKKITRGAEPKNDELAVIEANDEVGDVGFGLNVVDVLPLQPLPFLTFKEKHSATTLTCSGRTGATKMQQLRLGLDIFERYQNHVWDCLLLT